MTNKGNMKSAVWKEKTIRGEDNEKKKKKKEKKKKKKKKKV